MSDSGDRSNGNENGDRSSWRERVLSKLGLSRKKSIRTDLAEVLAEAIDPTQTASEFTPAEQTMLQNVLGLRERRVSDVMIARSEMVAVKQDIPIGQLLQTFANAGHSRLVVYGETLDEPTGMVHIRDLVSYLTAQAAAVQKRKRTRRKFDPKSIDLTQPLSDTKITRRILYVPPSMPAADLLVKMQATRIHLALVIDEYGGTDGLVSLEDIVEEIVGDIEDEHDDHESRIVALGDGSFLADARASLTETTETIGAGFDVGASGDEVDTLGGLLVTLAARVPIRNEILRGPGEFDFEIIDADPRRVKRVRIFRRPPDPPKRERKRKPKTAAGASAPQTPDSESATSGDMDNRNQRA
ncbi:MAG: HlyC/CorC family transporter [Rhizobiales bacterium]|nr:HlyC/CorC family transporter [Hyphomicrobiales bacterium]